MCNFSIKIWNEEMLISEISYCPAHGHMVTSVSTQMNQSDTFVSTSLDGTSLIWDIRLDKPASLLLENGFGFTASSWMDENLISLGCNDGNVFLVDVRMKQELNRNLCSQRSIFQVKFNTESELLAVCADEPTVYIFSTKEKNLNNV